MSYVEDITEALIGTLTYAGGLPAEKLAGHAANLEFWVGEVKHAFDVIDGYGERFKKLKRHSEGSVRPGINDHELKDLRRRLIDSVYLVLSRCYAEGLITEPEIEKYGERLDLDIRELKRRKRS